MSEYELEEIVMKITVFGTVLNKVVILYSENIARMAFSDQIGTDFVGSENSVTVFLTSFRTSLDNYSVG